MKTQGMKQKGMKQSGFTLMEILIAMVILLVGLCGVLALYPVAIKSAQQAVERTTAGVVAESVHQALVRAIRVAPATDPVVVQLVHDGCSWAGGNQYCYDFPLPTQRGQEVTCPRPGEGTDQSRSIFQLGWDEDSSLARVADNISQSGDPTVDYKQYGFAFDIIRVERMPLFELRLRVYRSPNTTDPIKEFRTFLGK